MNNLSEIQNKIIGFRNERDWTQFHDPKNLAEAISIEAGELLENFLWKTIGQSKNLNEEELNNVKEEIADIFIFLMYLCHEFKINLLDEVEKKIAIKKRSIRSGRRRGQQRSIHSCRNGQLISATRVHLKN